MITAPISRSPPSQVAAHRHEGIQHAEAWSSRPRARWHVRRPRSRAGNRGRPRAPAPASLPPSHPLRGCAAAAPPALRSPRASPGTQYGAPAARTVGSAAGRAGRRPGPRTRLARRRRGQGRRRSPDADLVAFLASRAAQEPRPGERPEVGVVVAGSGPGAAGVAGHSRHAAPPGRCAPSRNTVPCPAGSARQPHPGTEDAASRSQFVRPSAHEVGRRVETFLGRVVVSRRRPLGRIASSTTATRRWLWPKSMPSGNSRPTSRTRGGSAACRPGSHAPRRARALDHEAVGLQSETRLETVDRDKPVRRAISAREISPWSRSAWITRSRFRRRSDSREPARPEAMARASDLMGARLSRLRTNRAVPGRSYGFVCRAANKLPRPARPTHHRARQAATSPSGRRTSTSAGREVKSQRWRRSLNRCVAPSPRIATQRRHGRSRPAPPAIPGAFAPNSDAKAPRRSRPAPPADPWRLRPE